MTVIWLLLALIVSGGLGYFIGSQMRTSRFMFEVRSIPLRAILLLFVIAFLYMAILVEVTGVTEENTLGVALSGLNLLVFLGFFYWQFDRWVKERVTYRAVLALGYNVKPEDVGKVYEAGAYRKVDMHDGEYAATSTFYGRDRRFSLRVQSTGKVIEFLKTDFYGVIMLG